MATARPRTDLQLTVIKEVMLVGNVYKTFQDDDDYVPATIHSGKGWVARKPLVFWISQIL